MARKPLSKSEMMEAAATVYDQLLEGKTHTEVMDVLGYDAETYESVRKFMMDARSEEIRTKTKEHVYLEYIIEQRRNVHDLNNLIQNLDEKTQYNAVVGAIRLRSDIVDKILTRGQELGFIKKTAERRELIAGLLVADMTSDDLKKAITEQAKMLGTAMGKFGEGDFTDMTSGPLHYGEAYTTAGVEADDDDDDDEDDSDTLKRLSDTLKRLPAKSTGSHRAKTSKRSAGRKRVREES